VLVIGRVWRMAFDLHATDTELKAVNPLPRVAARVVLRVSRGCGRGELIGRVILHIPVALPHTPGATSPCLRSVRCRHGLTQDTADLVCYHGLRATYRSSLTLQHRYSCRQHTPITMSSTTTQTQTRTRQNVLKDYELHHSASSSRAISSSPAAPTPTPQAVPLNPPEWDTVHRRVPPYRPINRERDQSEVRVYTSPIERVFIGTMFTGVLINAVSDIPSGGQCEWGNADGSGSRRRPRSGEEWLGGGMMGFSSMPSVGRYRGSHVVHFI
jgi:hypothetical protein